ncbi:MAG: UDP-N-acetylmuramate--L-alanine ligase [Methylohalobius sp.]|nr:UDP-N-acetylmuramate--L-alanine ligase [Methylohalobius sp.]
MMPKLRQEIGVTGRLPSSSAVEEQIKRRCTKIGRIHLIGIGGAGMSGIAEVLVNLGYRVSGSDLRESITLQRLRALGVEVSVGHDAARVRGAEVVVVSSAVPDDNPERVAARRLRIPVISRAEMLAELMRFRFGIAVAGTHGKTTTTSLIASILAEAGLDPTFVIGGRLESRGSHAALGSSPFLVAEADESDASFLHLQPIIAVVTNVDRDHMDTYEGDFKRLQQTFVEFLHHIPFYGLAVVCRDDPGVSEILPEIQKPMWTYGFHPQADLRAHSVTPAGLKTYFVAEGKGLARPLPVELNLPGRHNLLNALAAIAVARELDIAPSAIQKALANFAGVGRRFGVHRVPWGGGEVVLVDDYGHHPRELAAVFAAARQAWPERRQLVVFQPHRYSRTRALLTEFAEVLSRADEVLLLPVYPAGEQPLPGGDSLALVQELARLDRSPRLLEALTDVPAALAACLKPQDVVLVMGAGSIGQLAASLPQALEELKR